MVGDWYGGWLIETFFLGAAPDQANARNQICSFSQLVFEVLFIAGIFLTFSKKN